MALSPNSTRYLGKGSSGKSSLDKGFLEACQPMGNNQKGGNAHGKYRSREGHSSSVRSSCSVPAPGQATSPERSPGQSLSNEGHNQIMEELQRVGRVSSETALAVNEVIKQIGSLHSLLEQASERNIGSSNRHMDVDMHQINAQLNAQVQQALAVHFEDLGQQVDTSVNRHINQTLAGHYDDLGHHIDNSMDRHTQELTQQLRVLEQLATPRAGVLQFQPPSVRTGTESDGMDHAGSEDPDPSSSRMTKTPAPAKLREVMDDEPASAGLATRFPTVAEFPSQGSSLSALSMDEKRKYFYNYLLKPASLVLVVVDFVFHLAGLQITLEHLARQPVEQPPPWILQVDAVLVMCFMVDLATRAYVKKWWAKPCQYQAGRLYVNLIVTSCSLLDVVLRAAHAPVHLASLRFIRAFRVIRAVRISKAVQNVGQRNKRFFEMVLFLECMWWSLAPFITILLVLFCLGLVLVTFFSEMIVASLASQRDFLPHTDLVRMYGSLWDTYVTLYTAAIGSADWGQLSAPLDALSLWHSFVFACIIILARCSLHILAAVMFVYVLRQRDSLLHRETMMNQERYGKVLLDLRELFRSSKTNGRDLEIGGRISEKTCRLVLEGLEGTKHLQSLGLSIDKAMGMFRMLEQDKQDHRKDVDEFIFLLSHSDGDPAMMLAALLRCESNRILYRLNKLFQLSEIRFAQVLQEDPAVISGKLDCESI